VCGWPVDGRDDGRLMLGRFCGWSVVILIDIEAERSDEDGLASMSG